MKLPRGINKKTAAAVMLSAISMSNLCYSATTATINVAATVASACNFLTTSYTLNFGSYLQPDTAGLAVASPITFNCSAIGASNVVFSLNGGNSGNPASRYMLIGGAGAQLQYSIYQPTGIPTPPTTPGTCPTIGAGGTLWGDGTTAPTLSVPISGYTAGTTYNVNMCGQIPANQSVVAGTYTDTLTMTMTVT